MKPGEGYLGLDGGYSAIECSADEGCWRLVGLYEAASDTHGRWVRASRVV